MNKNELKAYFYDLHTIELQTYICKKIVEAYQSAINQLKSSKYKLKDYELFAGEICPPSKNNRTIPTPLELEKYLEHKADTDPAFDAAYYIHLAAPFRWWNKDLAPICENADKTFFGLRLSKIKKESNTYRLLLETYTSNYNTELEKKYSYVAPKLNYLSEEYTRQILPVLRDTYSLRERMYSLYSVPQIYQNYAAITQIYQYMADGKCQTPEDAYHLYETGLHRPTLHPLSLLAASEELSRQLVNNCILPLAELAPNTALSSYLSSCHIILNDLTKKYEK